MATANHRQEKSHILYRITEGDNYLFKYSEILRRVDRSTATDVSKTRNAFLFRVMEY